MLDDNLKTQLRAYMERLVNPIELVAYADDSENAKKTLALLDDIVPLSDKITLRHSDGTGGDTVARKPTFAVTLPGEDRKSTRLNSSHVRISYAVFCLKKKS